MDVSFSVMHPSPSTVWDLYRSLSVEAPKSSVVCDNAMCTGLWGGFHSVLSWLWLF